MTTVWFVFFGICDDTVSGQSLKVKMAVAVIFTLKLHGIKAAVKFPIDLLRVEL